MNKRLYTSAIILGLLISICYPFVKSPNVKVYKERDEILLENIFLGEYYLGLDKIKIQSLSDHAVICEIEHYPNIYAEDQQQVNALEEYTHKGNYKQAIKLKKGSNDEQSIWGITSKHSPQKPCLLKKETYTVSVWGNNGFGFSTLKRLKINIP